jgi:hypothetical protein
MEMFSKKSASLQAFTRAVIARVIAADAAKIDRMAVIAFIVSLPGVFN